jgi:hypothetical protein
VQQQKLDRQQNNQLKIKKLVAGGPNKSAMQKTITAGFGVQGSPAGQMQPSSALS